MTMCNKDSIIITYLYNCGIAIEIQDILLVFDYCAFIPAKHGKGLLSGIIPLSIFEKKRKIYIFVTHGHIDHYNEDILRWGDKYNNVIYIISDDIKTDKKVNLIHSGKEIIIDGIKVVGYPSNDLGVSYYVEINGLKIFHAGDLNLWYWAPKPGEEHSKKNKIKYRIAKISFLKALGLIKNLEIDIAFFPVTSLIGGKYYEGGLRFCQEVHPTLFVPVHFASNYYVTKEFKEIMNIQGIEVWAISHRGEQYFYSIKK